MSVRSISLVFMAGAVVCFARQSAPLQSPTHPAGRLETAQKLIDAGHSAEALKQLDALAAQTPEPTGVERLRGFAYYQQKNMPAADQAYARALAQDPSDRESMQMRGVVLFSLGKPAEAIPLLERAHTAMPSANVDPNYVLGVCYIETRRYDDARRAFSAQYNFPPDSAAAYLLAARLLLRRENPDAAEQFARKALALNPGLPLAHLLLGEVALTRALFPQAIAEFEKERNLNPLYGGIYDRLGDAYVRSGDYEEAQTALDRAVLLEPTSTGPYILLGRVMLNQRNYLLATLYLERALKMDPSNYMAHTLLGQAYGRTGRTAEAAQQFQTANRLQNGISTAPTAASGP